MDPFAAAALYLLSATVALGVLAAAAATCAIWLVWRLSHRGSASASIEGPRRFRAGVVFALLLLFALPASCLWVARPRPQPPSLRTVAAIEVPLQTAADRADLLAILQHLARENGCHLDDSTAKWIEMRRNAPPEEPAFARRVLTKTIYAAVWRGSDDRDLEILIDDGGHQGRAWLTFSQGKRPELATKLRTRVLGEIKRRWPEARDVPVMPNGALPRAEDLLWTGGTYVVKPDRAAAYGQSANEATQD
jgi:hypothetical protein